MRIAVLADIHGNLPAFEAALADAQAQKPDYLLIAGDLVVGSPDSAACWHLAQSLGVPLLRGNHERYVYDFGTPDAPAITQTERFAPVRWAAAQFTAAEKAAMRTLPQTLRLPDVPDVLFVHASARNDGDLIFPYTPADDLDPMFAGTTERVIVRGHNHIAAVRLWRNRVIVTTGSVGLAQDGSPTAQYLILEGSKSGWEVCHRSTSYPVAQTVRRFHQSGYLAQTGVMGRLFLREVEAAAMWIVPFLRAYEEWEREGMTLEAGYARFLGGDG